MLRINIEMKKCFRKKEMKNKKNRRNER